MPYTRAQNWVDGYDGKTPITAAALNHIEDGLAAATSTADAASAAGTAARTAVDAVAAAALVGGIAWTSSWWVNAEVTKTDTEITTSTTATSGTTGRIGSNTKELPGGRTYRFSMVVSAVGDTTIQMGGYYLSSSGTYLRSQWPSNSGKSVPAGAERVTVSVDLPIAYNASADESKFQFIAYNRPNGNLLTIHLAKVEDVTDLVAAQSTASAAQSTASAAQSTASAAQTAAAAANAAIAALVTPAVYTWSHAAGAVTAATVLTVPVGSPPSPITKSGDAFVLPSSCHGAVCMVTLRQANAASERRFVEVVTGGADNLEITSSEIIARSSGMGEDRVTVTWIGVPGGTYTVRQYKTSAGSTSDVGFRVIVF